MVLPMAHADQLVMSAVLTVSAFHQNASWKNDYYVHRLTSVADSRYCEQSSWTTEVPRPQALYDATIKALRQRSSMMESSHEAKEAVLTAVLVLLVASMVTGRDEYPTILGMLCSATSAFGGEDQLGSSELGGFLVRQLRK